MIFRVTSDLVARDLLLIGNFVCCVNSIIYIIIVHEIIPHKITSYQITGIHICIDYNLNIVKLLQILLFLYIITKLIPS